MPSPTADPNCFVEPARTSPAAKTLDIDVSMVSLVTRNPPESLSAAPPRNSVFGWRPMKTNAAAPG